MTQAFRDKTAAWISRAVATTQKSEPKMKPCSRLTRTLSDDALFSVASFLSTADIAQFAKCSKFLRNRFTLSLDRITPSRALTRLCHAKLHVYSSSTHSPSFRLRSLVTPPMLLTTLELLCAEYLATKLLDILDTVQAAKRLTSLNVVLPRPKHSFSKPQSDSWHARWGWGIRYCDQKPIPTLSFPALTSFSARGPWQVSPAELEAVGTSCVT